MVGLFVNIAIDVHRCSHRRSQADLCLRVNVVNGNPSLEEKRNIERKRHIEQPP
jgi:hypothetical protein